ncbi:5647_t:CDS:1, partial [Racocetra fulgida]
MPIEEELPNNRNSHPVKCSNGVDALKDDKQDSKVQITDTSYEYDTNLNEIIETICCIYQEEEMKGNFGIDIINLIDQLLTSKQQKPE